MTAAESLRGGPTGEGLPVLFLGSSRGTMASGWAMAMNFDRSCTYDEPAITCREAKGDPSIKGAMLFAEYTSGAGYVPQETTPKDAGRRHGHDRDPLVSGRGEEQPIDFLHNSRSLVHHT